MDEILSLAGGKNPPELYIFEGSEKRLEIHFGYNTLNEINRRSLRDISKETISSILELACCTIVSETKSKWFDSYVLSESSLFIYPQCFVLKTCGKTKLLNCLRFLFSQAEILNLEPIYIKYSRAAYLFESHQDAPYGNFANEIDLLKAQVDKDFLKYCKVHELGESKFGLTFHSCILLKENGAVEAYEDPHNLFNYTTLEICCTNISQNKALNFHKISKDYSASDVTVNSGIDKIVEQAQVDDYLFDPCGYSCNAVWDKSYFTIHVTPEEHQSYASFELFCPNNDVPYYMNKVFQIF